MNYTLHQLQIFLKVSQKQSVTKAAEELHLTQPAVSIQLKKFQEQFDIPLTEVIGRKLYITDFGKELAEVAESILNQAYAINYKTESYKGLLTGRLKLSIVSTGKYVMPYFLSDFIREHKEIELVMDVTNKKRVIKSLEENEVDFSLVSILPSTFAVETEELLENRLYLVGNSQMKINLNRGIKRIFSETPMIFREPGSGTRQTMEQYIKKHDLEVVQKMELTSNEAVKQAVLAGLGFSIMPLIGIKNELKNGDLQIFDVKGLPITTMWSLINLKGKSLSPVALAFLNFIKEEKERIAASSFDWYLNPQI